MSIRIYSALKAEDISTNTVSFPRNCIGNRCSLPLQFTFTMTDDSTASLGMSAVDVSAVITIGSSANTTGKSDKMLVLSSIMKLNVDDWF